MRAQVDHLTLPLVESRIEHVLSPLRLPGQVRVEVVELSMDRPERDGDGRIGIRRIENPVLLLCCAQPRVLGWD